MSELAVKKIVRWLNNLCNKKCEFCSALTYKLYPKIGYNSCLACITEQDYEDDIHGLYFLTIY